jgi:hypothetical protein
MRRLLMALMAMTVIGSATMTDNELVKALCDLGLHSAVICADRIEALTAERDRFQRAFAAQSAKLHIALDVGGEPVRAALKGETP